MTSPTMTSLDSWQRSRADSSEMENDMKETTYSLRSLTEEPAARFQSITELYLFGSRKWRTGSPRSDLDILVCHSKHIRPSDLRYFALSNCPALDLFLVDGSKATSAANESCVEAGTFEELIARLGAIHFWSRGKGFLNADIDWDFPVASGIDFVPTALLGGLPESFNWSKELGRLFEFVEVQGLPYRPFIGTSACEVAEFLIQVFQRLLPETQQLNAKGKGIVVRFHTEYDLQNIFFLAVKPWLPCLAREEVTIRYDGQEKVADFNAFGNQVVIEMKHVRDANTKAAVAKTLSGLGDFYRRHPNVRVLIFFILVDPSVDLDDHRWETEYSYLANTPTVRTVILRNPT